MRIKFSFITIVAAYLILSALVGCECSWSEDPYLEDRTEGWEPAIMVNVPFRFDQLDAESGELWNDIIEFKPYCYGQRITNANFWKAVAEVLKLYLVDAHREFTIPNKPESRDGKTGFINNDFAIVFEDETGRLVFFADIKNNPQLTYKDSKLILTIDVAKLNATQLAELHSIHDARIVEKPFHPRVLGISLPLTAEGAYEISLNMGVKKWKYLGRTGGAFKVYSSERSNTMLVVANTYVQAFDINSGKMIMMYIVYDRDYLNIADRSVQRDKD